MSSSDRAPEAAQASDMLEISTVVKHTTNSEKFAEKNDFPRQIFVKLKTHVHVKSVILGSAPRAKAILLVLKILGSYSAL